ncbi:MAG: PDZ domain-containing protein [Oscillospiraceae bacterium]|nr:PDZ domain-containing protein [Oscillospiraceae bacterium]
MNEQSFEYRTGRTSPRQKHNGIIAFLLILVIFLSGLVSVLGILNIHLFRKLQQAGSETSLSFAQGDLTPAAPEGNSLTIGGITVQEPPEVYQQIYDLPAGLYVVDSQLETILPGDVLTKFDGAAITTLEELKTLYGQKKDGDQLWFTFCRQGKDFSLTLPFGN